MPLKPSDLARLAELDTAWDLSLDDTARAQVDAFADFLATDGVMAGGIGPTEPDRIFDRHIADSLAYLVAAKSRAEESLAVLDVGSGVGLPGIPIAIARPSWSVTLVDRAQRRTDLASRAIRICGLSNAVAMQADIRDMAEHYDLVVFRASLPVDEAARIVPTLLAPKGQAVFGVSRLELEPNLGVELDGWDMDLTDVGRGMLDSPAWLLRMTRI